MLEFLLSLLVAVSVAASDGNHTSLERVAPQPLPAMWGIHTEEHCAKYGMDFYKGNCVRLPPTPRPIVPDPRPAPTGDPRFVSCAEYPTLCWPPTAP